MSGTPVISCTTIKSGDQKKGLYLLLYNCKKSPPHIILCYNGEFFSLGVNGSHMGVNMVGLMKRIERSHIPCLWVEIETGGISPALTMKNLAESFGGYSPLAPGGETCLDPVKKFFTLQFGPANATPSFVYELIPLLQEQGKVKNIYCQNFSPENGKFSLPVYSKQEIDTAIMQAAKVTP